MIKLREWFTIPNPELEYSSRRFDVEVEAPTYEEALTKLQELTKKEKERKFPDLFLANDRLAVANTFIRQLLKDPVIGFQVQAKRKAYQESLTSTPNN